MPATWWKKVEISERPAGRWAGRPAGRPGGARVVSGAEKKNHLIEGAPFGCLNQMLSTIVSSAAPKKESFDRGGPVWPPRSNVTNDRLRGGLGGLCPPSQNSGGLGGSAPQPKYGTDKSIIG